MSESKKGASVWVVALVAIRSATIIIFIIKQRGRKFTCVKNVALVIIMSATKLRLYKIPGK